MATSSVGRAMAAGMNIKGMGKMMKSMQDLFLPGKGKKKATKK